MSYAQNLTYTSAATQPSIGLDAGTVPFNATIMCTLLGGAVASYKMQYTLNELNGPLAVDADANWMDSPDIPAGTAANSFASLTTPIARVRLVIASLTGGSLQVQVRQGYYSN
jgi:hypothetical protein